MDTSLFELARQVRKLQEKPDKGGMLHIDLAELICEVQDCTYANDAMRVEDLRNRCLLCIDEIVSYAKDAIESEQSFASVAKGILIDNKTLGQQLMKADLLLQKARKWHEEKSKSHKEIYFLWLSPDRHLLDSNGNTYDLSQEQSQLLLEIVASLTRGIKIYEDQLNKELPHSYKGNVRKYIAQKNEAFERKGFKKDCIVLSCDDNKGRYCCFGYEVKTQVKTHKVG
ncbi:hypothetical protein KKC44_06130 [Patescibacteria group bacterium]|nr:hypothetical protein [Patescibacteria group bacterium]MBU2260149.1 hypothetical protein [Patescibacteria group bacterium]